MPQHSAKEHRLMVASADRLVLQPVKALGLNAQHFTCIPASYTEYRRDEENTKTTDREREQDVAFVSRDHTRSLSRGVVKENPVFFIPAAAVREDLCRGERG